MHTTKLKINIGPLQSVAQLHLYMQDSLQKFTKYYTQYKKTNSPMPIVIFDLRESKYANVSVLTAFLSISERLRMYTEEPIEIICPWMPEFFTFLDNVKFIKISNKLNLFKWPETFGGYDNKIVTNPNSTILYFDNKLFPSPPQTEKNKLYEWKDASREVIQYDMHDILSQIFKDTMGKNLVSHLEVPVKIILSELILNGLLWGESKVFAGIQRDNKKITVSICDSGHGFKSTILKKTLGNKINVLPKTDIESVLLGCVINKVDKRARGLRSVIDLVLKEVNASKVIVSSGRSEIVWSKNIWEIATTRTANTPITRIHLDTAIREIKKTVQHENINEKFETFSEPLRGSKIIFEILTNATYNEI